MFSTSDKTSNPAENGFTLVELMLVVAIIGILSAIAIPQFLAYQCKSRQVEARQFLGSIAKAQEAYFANADRYGSTLAAIGMLSGGNVSKGRARYDYTITAADEFSFSAEARSVAPGLNFKGAGDDVWTVNHTLLLTNTVNACN